MFTNTTKKTANYNGRTCKEPKDISLTIEKLKDATFMMPVKGSTYSDEIRTMLLAKELDLHIKQRSTFRQNKATMFAVVISQCTDAIKEKIEADTTYNSISQDRDVIKLLILMRDIAFKYESDRYHFLALHLLLK